MKYLWKALCWQNCAHNRRSVSFKPSLHASAGSGKVWYTCNWGPQIANVGRVFFHVEKQVAHANLSILHLHKNLGPQVECLHTSLESQMVQSQVEAPFVMCLRWRGCLSSGLLPCIPHAVGWTSNSPREPQASKAFSGVSTLEPKVWLQLGDTYLR